MTKPYPDAPTLGAAMAHAAVWDRDGRPAHGVSDRHDLISAIGSTA